MCSEITKRHTVTGGERLTMADGSVWFHPFSGAAPVQEQSRDRDYELGRIDGSTPGRVFGHSFNPGWKTPQERRDFYRAGYTAGREGRE
jgi:hypothetical protein